MCALIAPLPRCRRYRLMSHNERLSKRPDEEWLAARPAAARKSGDTQFKKARVFCAPCAVCCAQRQTCARGWGHTVYSGALLL